MKVSDIIVNFLLDNNIDTVFTVSGGGCIHLIDSLRKSNINTICMHHEQSAVMAAEGYTRFSKKMCATIVTTGPGGTNTITGLLGLWLDSIPSIIISGQVSTSQMSEGTGCRQIGDQEFDIVSTVKNMTKYAVTIKNSKDILYELGKAYAISNSDRPGPVWIDVPLDIQGAEIDKNICSIFNTKNNFKKMTNDQKLLFVKLLQNSKKPLIIIGNGINLSQTNKELEDFLLLTGIPVVTGPHSGIDAVDNTYENYCGRIGILGQLTSNEIVQQADLIICLGTRLPLKMTGYNINEFSPNSKKIIVDIDENEILKHKFNIDLKIIANLRTFFKDISDIVFTSDISNWQKYTKNIRSNQKYYYDKHKNLKNYTSFYYLINKSSNIFENIPIVTSNGTAHVVTMQNYLINKNQRVFTNVGCASMGYGLPAAIGASIANHNKQVICIEGDGSIMMNLQELQTIISYKLPIKLLIINNDGYLSIKLSQESFFNGEEFASGPENGVTLPSYEKIANAFNIKYMSIKNNKEIDTILKQMVDYPEACIVEVFTHPKERHEPKVIHKGIDENGNIIPGTLTDMVVSEIF